MDKESFMLVRKSWDIIAKIDFEIIGGIFYMRLFEIAPELRSMFKINIKAQSVKLGCMITYVISKFDNMEIILKEVTALAERHRKYGVKDEQYAYVGDALMWTLEKGLGEYWTPELKNAWLDFYQTLSNVMITGKA